MENADYAIGFMAQRVAKAENMLSLLETDKEIVHTKLSKLENRLSDVEFEIADRLSLVEKKLEQIPTIIEAIQNKTKTIKELGQQNFQQKIEIRELQDKLDSYSLLHKFICASAYPSLLYGEVKEMHGLLCPSTEQEDL